MGKKGFVFAIVGVFLIIIVMNNVQAQTSSVGCNIPTKEFQGTINIDNNCPKIEIYGITGLKSGDTVTVLSDMITINGKVTVKITDTVAISVAGDVIINGRISIRTADS